MAKKKVALIYGGRSVEHEISVRSTINVAQYIEKDKFDIYLIGINKKGDWFHTDSVIYEIGKGEPVHLRLSASCPAFETETSRFVPDIIFPVLHGTDGEDGSIQGFFQVVKRPVVGSGVLGSSIAMDKVISKKLLEAEGLPVAKYFHFTEQDRTQIDFEEMCDQLGLPFMIKSANLGSSVGVTKVKDKKTFAEGLKEGFEYADEILIETFIEGMEVECAIAGNDPAVSTWPGEIHIKKDYEFYTYAAKYQDPDAIDMVIPAPLSKEVQWKVRKLSEQAFKALKCTDYARVDLFVTTEGKVFLNEVNTIPGFTNVSMFPSMWKNMGVSYPELITKLINLASERWEKESKLQTHYKKA